MSWFFNKKDVEKGKTDCVFCGKPVIEDGEAFIIQQINVTRGKIENSHYSLNEQRKFLSHSECLTKNLFHRDFPDLKVEESMYKHIEMSRKKYKQVWMLENIMVHEGCTQEEFDSISIKVAKRLLNDV